MKWSSSPARVIWRASARYSGPMNPTTELTSSGSKASATACARASQTSWSIPSCASADSALPCPVSK